MMDDTKDRYRPRTLDDAEPPSLINEPIAYRDTGDSTVLHRWPRARPLHAVIAETLANVELLLAQLECGVRVADNQRELVRQLYVSTQRQREVLSAALRLEELE